MIEPNAGINGLFRILVEPQPGKPGWPAQEFVRPGGKVRGWVQGDTVLVGYELWRQLNDFPLEFGQNRAAATVGGAAKGAPPKAGEEGDTKK